MLWGVVCMDQCAKLGIEQKGNLIGGDFFLHEDM